VEGTNKRSSPLPAQVPMSHLYNSRGDCVKAPEPAKRSTAQPHDSIHSTHLMVRAQYAGPNTFVRQIILLRNNQSNRAGALPQVDIDADTRTKGSETRDRLTEKERVRGGEK
jgi:hypothetical protein